jgi:hypothetical protein
LACGGIGHRAIKSPNKAMIDHAGGYGGHGKRLIVTVNRRGRRLNR